MRTIWMLACGLAATAAGCTPRESPPQYMQSAPAGEDEVRKAIEAIRQELGQGFSVERVEGLFYLAANGGPEELRRCRGTIERMYGFLTKEFFEKKAIQPIRVYCFEEAADYNRYCLNAYGRAPSTPYGFYMSDERKMVMNISTGTGTLAHELVHPLLAEDFPAVPTWFNEGFASLYEQSRPTADGRMEGLVNWRLKGLKTAMKEGHAVALADLLKLSSSEFYDEKRGVNYATARYLCQWLQEEQKLPDFYREFKAGAPDDPTGRAALEKVTGRKLDEIERVWKEWVLGLE